MSPLKFFVISFLVPSMVLFGSTDARAEDVLDKLKGDFSNHPMLQSESFQVEIKGFDHGFLSLYMPTQRASADSSERRLWKKLREKAESLALKYPEVKDVTWFSKGDGVSGDKLYEQPGRYGSNWTARFHFGGGMMSWSGDNSWDGGSSSEVFVSNIDFGKIDWPVNLQFSSKSTTARYSLVGGSGDRYRIHENSIGVRKYFSRSSFSPYLSGGWTHINISADRSNTTSGNGDFMDWQVTSTNAGYIDAGFVKKLGKYFEGGLEIRAVQSGKATVELIENDMSNNTANLFIGWGF